MWHDLRYWIKGKIGLDRAQILSNLLIQQNKEETIMTRTRSIGFPLKMVGVGFLILSLFFVLSPLSFAQSAKIATETMMVPAGDPGIQLHVRNKHPEGVSNFAPDRIVLFVHGAIYCSESGFDLPLSGLSWMDYIAQRGWDVYIMDLRGYGRSTRPS